ncbi:MAG: carbohydrate kinase [Flavobacteriaceae bacterium]
MSKIVCFGEVLWDVFPTHKKIGGAPLNVALRLNYFGNYVTIISSVGNDIEGKEIIDFIKINNVNTDEIQVNNEFNTSQVKVVLDKSGSASYNIAFPCAWDYIQLKAASKNSVSKSDAFIFGSLVTRNDVSRVTLIQLLKFAKFKVFDVNLRAPHYTMIVLNELMIEADFIKFNDDELLEICKYYDFKSNNLEESIKYISNKTNTQSICVTLGGDGAILFKRNTFYKSSGYSVKVKDTVGAGDSFLATLIHGLLNNEKPQDAINLACAVGALVASMDGANPIILKADIESIME